MQQSSNEQITLGLDDSLILSQLDEQSNLDVVWDWHSPSRNKKRTKRRNVQQSPKLTIKRASSNSHIQSFTKLEEEMRILKDQVECCKNNATSTISDIFSDSMEEELILCSQKVEKELLNVQFKTVNPLKSNTTIKDPIEHVSQLPCEDSLTIALREFESDFSFPNEDIFTCDIKETKPIEVRSSMEDKQSVAVPNRKVIRENIRKPNSSSESEPIIKCSPEEIEKKRLQALAKLRAKKNARSSTQNRVSNSLGKYFINK